MTSTDLKLNKYTVIYVDVQDGVFWQFFSCMAEDADHAESQCMNAYPDAYVLWVNEGTSRLME